MSEAVQWADAPRIPQLEEGEVHVWRAFEVDAARLLSQLGPTLSQDERARAGRLQVARERDRFVVARGVLRDILGRYLRVSPADIRFEYSEAGKPELASLGNVERIRFNVTHSGELALYGIARERQIGVDIERVRPFRKLERIAERFFAASEWSALRLLPADLRDEGFFNCWTRKEAFLKATGVGVAYPLSSFAVTLRPGEPARFLELGPDVVGRTHWSLAHLAPASGYVGALCFEGPIRLVRYFGWRSSNAGLVGSQESSAG